MNYDGPIFDLPQGVNWIKGVGCNTMGTSCLFAGKNDNGDVLITSNYDSNRTVVTATAKEWQDFLTAVREGTFDNM